MLDEIRSRNGRGRVEQELQRSLLSAIGRMTETLGRAEGSARKGDLNEAMVFLAALERDAGGNAKALAQALGALDDLEETRRKLREAYGE